MTDHAEHPLEDILDEAIESSHGEKIRLVDLLEEFGTRSFGPILIVLSIIIISPIGSVPGLPIAFGAVIVLFSVQLMVGRRHPWIPRRLQQTGVDKHKAEEWRDKWHGWLERIDRLIRHRLEWASGEWGRWLASFCLVFLSLTMIPLELIPFGVTLPGAAMLFFGVGLTARDGLFMLLGFAVTLPSLWFTISWWPWGGG